MSTVHPAPVFRNTAPHRPLSGTLLAATLAVAAACGLFALGSGMLSQQPALTQCAEIVAGPARLACYDLIGNDALSAPAKGANAPAFAR